MTRRCDNTALLWDVKTRLATGEQCREASRTFALEARRDRDQGSPFESFSWACAACALLAWALRRST